MYDQRHGHNLFQLKMADKDLSNKALGITDTKKRSREDDDKPPIAIKKIKKTFPYYLLQNSIIFVVGDDKTFITTWLNDRKIPYVQEKNGTILVKSDKYEFVYELLGTPSSAYKEPTVLSNLKRSLEEDNKPPVVIKTKFPYYRLDNRYLFVVGDDKMVISKLLIDKKIPFIVENNGDISVKSRSYSSFFELLGTPSSAYKEPTVLSNLKRSLEEDNKPPVVIKTKFPYYRLDNRYLFIVGDDKMVISKLLIDKKIPFIVENNGDISVKSRSYSSFFELLGTPSSAYKEPAVLSNLKRSRLDIDVHEPFITFNGGFVADWYHFRGLSYFQVPWMDYIHNAKITNNHVFILNGVPSIYHVAVKRSSKWSSHIIDSKINIGTNISITPKFGEFIDNKDFLKYDVVFTFLVHEFSATSRHGNAIIIDNVNKLFIRFEPHGAYSECYDVKQCDINFKEMIKNYVPLSRYSYIGPTYQNEKGPQTIEENQTLYNTVVEKIGSTERTLEAGGFCMAWAILCCQYYNDNSRHGYRYDEVYKHLNLSTNELATLIRHFQGWLVNLAKESFGEHYVLIKENLGIK
jgi:hypothetical protein